MSYEKTMMILLTVELMKKISLYYFPELYTPSKSKINVELDLLNYATESDFKNATVADASKLAKVVDLANLK